MTRKRGRVTVGRSRRALIISTDEYSSLPGIQFAASGITDLAAVLEQSPAGDYEVTTLHNASHAEASASISAHFSAADEGAEILLYVFGYVLASSATGRLYLAFTDTILEREPEAACPVQLLQAVSEGTAARNVIIILDLCYPPGSEDIPAVSILDSILQGSSGALPPNFAVMASSMRHVTHKARQANFTQLILEGVKGRADLNGDLIVTVPELNQYVMREFLARPEPSFISYGDAAQLIISTIGYDTEIITVDPCPNCETEGGHSYKVPVAKDVVNYLMSPGKPVERFREFRVVFRCPVNAEPFAVTLRIFENVTFYPIRKVGEPVLLSPRGTQDE